MVSGLFPRAIKIPEISEATWLPLPSAPPLDGASGAAGRAQTADYR
jgi:hypothetical protein